MDEFSHDVVVVGGGPAGSTTATMLARKGWRVVLLERERFPREHIGESLLPGSIPVLEQLGVARAVERAGFVKKWGATMVWGSDSSPWSWFFQESNERYPHAYQVWRPTFDELLLDNSRSNGVEVREGNRVLEVLFDDGRACGVRCQGEDGRVREIRARYVVDATGQTGLIGRALRLRKEEPDFRNLAIYGYFRGVARPQKPADGNIFIESFEHGWVWTIPLQDDQASIGIVMDSQAGQRLIRENGAEQVYNALLKRAPYTARMLATAERTTETKVTRDWSYHSIKVAGPGYVLVGDAACFIDPLFSSGVHLALHSGVLASAYVTTALKRPEMEQKAGAVYQEMYYQQFDHFRELARLFYASNRTVDSYFWEARRILNDDTSAPREAFIRGVTGQPPQGYERAVLDRGLAPPDFSKRKGELEARKEERRELVDRAMRGKDLTGTPFYRSIPRLASTLEITTKPVLVDGEFREGPVLTQPWDPSGTPISAELAELLGVVDGTRTVGAIARTLAERIGLEHSEQLLPSVAAAIRALYVDGSIAELEEIQR